MTPVRCAIYTRKSSEDGLEQDFNSLHAQREACAAYVLSQASEGWQLIPAAYDDGGLSGGTLKRPALERLLADIAAGGIDIVVVYKVDRLTRSLIDFAKLIEAFDASDTSFVSITQSFNTTTSMGRLTLNMLLSFAQFEREVTAERIRDKIAASKAKGMWMGGLVPLGYQAHGRSLKVIEKHARVVRDIYARYARTGNVRLVADELAAEQITIPKRKTGTGKELGGGRFSRGQLYAILRNPIYVGDIAHKGTVYRGQHKAIIGRDEWQAVQSRLASHCQGGRRGKPKSDSNPLAGRIFDSADDPLIAVHSFKRLKNKTRKRYRYYVSKALQHTTRGEAPHGLRIPASEIEQVIAAAMASQFENPLDLAETTQLIIEPDTFATFQRTALALAGDLRANNLSACASILVRVEVHDRHIVLDLDIRAISTRLGCRRRAPSPDVVSLRHDVRLTRTGHTMRLVDHGGGRAFDETPDATLVRLALRARSWWHILSHGELTPTELARREGVTSSYLIRVVRLAFLSPRVVDALLDGNLRADVNAAALLSPGAIDPDWLRQERRLLAG